MNDKLNNDIEETDEYEINETSVNFLEKKQRELLTSTIDYNLESLYSLIKKRVIDLKPKYQRRFRWDDARKSKLIESFLMNVPIPPIFLNEDDYGKYSVIDGKQRLSAIYEFLLGELKLSGLEVFKNLNKSNFFDLTPEFQNSLKIRANIRAIIILRQSDKDIKYEVFQRLNTGGVKLNAQEIRNSAFPSILNDKILELSQNKKFQKLLGIKTKEKSRIYQEMKDAELVLRFFTLKDTWEDYGGGLKLLLDNYLDKNKDFNEKIVSKLENDFIETLNSVQIIFGENASFRRWIPKSKKWKQQMSAPLFDMQMLGLYKANIDQLKLSKELILEDYKKLFNTDKEFIESIQSSTTSPSKFDYRIQRLLEIFAKYS
jgi:hypothetical protein